MLSVACSCRAGLEAERRGLTDKLASSQAHAADLARALEAARRTEASLRREAEAAAKQAAQVCFLNGCVCIECVREAEAAAKQAAQVCFLNGCVCIECVCVCNLLSCVKHVCVSVRT